jgi:hypothetical protein
MSPQSHRYQRQKGQLLIMVSLLIVPMFGMLGLVTDFGYMHYVKMEAQTAAEAAAEAAIINFHETLGGASLSCGGQVICSATSPTACPSNITNPQNPIQHGCMYAQVHGFNGANQTVTYQSNVSSTPPTVPGIGSAVYWVTFRAVAKVPQMFSAVLGNPDGLVVGRSTAAIVGSADCIYAMDPNQGDIGVSVSGTGNLTSSCGLYVNSSNACAIKTNGGGNGNGLTAPEYDVVGQTCANPPLSPTPNTGVYPASDPLASLPVPASAPYTCGPGYSGGGNGKTITIDPGVYCGGIQVKNNTVNFNPGIYILVGGGLTTQDSNSIINTNPGGVMFYNTFGATIGNGNKTYTYSPISIAANSIVTLKASNTGTYAGILFFEDRNGYCSGSPCNDTYGGGSTAVYQGVIYAPHANITMYGNSSQNAAYTEIVAWTISLVGTTNFGVDYSGLPGGMSPLQKVALVE